MKAKLYAGAAFVILGLAAAYAMTSAMVATSTACAAGQNLTSVNNNYTGWLSATDGTTKTSAALYANTFEYSSFK